MISIVCSSITPDEKYKKEILSKIGLKDVEFLHYENKGEYSLTDIYKKGLDDSQYDIVLFVHDDIIVNTKNWGRKLIKHFNDTNYGILGVAGTTKLSEEGTWWSSRNDMVGIVNHKHQNHTYTSKYSANLGENIVKAILVDGVFFAVQKDRLKYEFDINVKGFHFYDIDFTFGNHIAGCDVGVMFDIRITHLSIGQTNEKWEANKAIFVAKREFDLPCEIVGEMFYDEPTIKIKKQPKVTIIIPHIHNNSLLFTCLNSLFKTNYTNYEVIVADTGSNGTTISEIEAFTDPLANVRLVRYDYYNFGKINNDVVKNYVTDDTELILFCNNDIEMINDALSMMVKYYINNKQTIGTIGCRLHFDNKRIQHSGIVALYQDSNKRFNLSHEGLNSYYFYDAEPKKVLGNTGAFLMINKILFNQLGTFNEAYSECFEDVELNLNALLLNKDNVNISDAVCWNRESSTRSINPDKNKNESEDYNKIIIPFIHKHQADKRITKHIKIIS